MRPLGGFVRFPFLFKLLKQFYHGCCLGCKLSIILLLLKIRALCCQMIFFLAQIIMKICLLRISEKNTLIQGNLI